jgi:flagellar FliL protein
MANLDSAATEKSGPSLVIQVGVLAVLTLLAVGGGWFAGVYLKESESAEAEIVKVTISPVMPQMAAPPQADAPPEPAATEPGVKLIPRLVPLDAVTTNLAAPADIWVRMEVSVVFSSPPSTELTQQIHQDILAYMRTVTLQQIQGGSGFRHLKADLDERVRVRSNGLATDLMIRTLLFE